MLLRYLSVFFGFLCCFLSAAAEQKTVDVSFYSEILQIDYDSQMDVDFQESDSPSDAVFQKFYYEMNNANYLMILANLFYYKKELNLNDWFYYLLIRQSAETIFSHRSDVYKTLFCWFLLQKSGYVVQLAYAEKDVSISVFTTDKTYELPSTQDYPVMIEVVSEKGTSLQKGYYADISIKKSGSKKDTPFAKIAMMPFRIVTPPNSLKGRPFSFLLDRIPTFNKNETESRKLTFIHDKVLKQIDVNINKTAIYAMYGYPELSVEGHTHTPFSPEVNETLIAQLRQMIEGKSDTQAARLLLSFTRQAMKYQTDRIAYSRDNLTLFAEETLFYKYSDCEDRSILFYQLVRDLLALDVVLVRFPEHVTVGVLFDKPYGKTFEQNNKQYTICDPTGPGNDLDIGEVPEVFKNVQPTLMTD